MASTSGNDKKVERKFQYKELIEKGARIGESLANQNVIESLSNIMDILNNCEDISTGYAREARVENTADYLMDASIIKMSHDLMGSMTEKMSNNDFREDEYIASLLNLLTTNPDRILDAAVDCCKTAKFQLSMLGTFDFEAPNKTQEMKKKAPRARKTLEPKAAPENIKQVAKHDKGAEKINIVQSELKRVFCERKVDCIPYYEVIINPHDYMKTIDTAFQVAFLVRDGIVGVDLIDGVPNVILKNDASTAQSCMNDPANTGQAIMALDPPTWKEEIANYNIKAPLLHLTSDDEYEEVDSD